jgi:hypothetical protein
MHVNFHRDIFALAMTVIALIAWLVAVFSYLSMMKETVSGIDVRLLCKQLEIRSNLLFITRPDIFTSKGTRYRFWYVTSLFVFAASLVAMAAVLSFINQGV